MIIIREKSTGLVPYLFENGTSVRMTERGLIRPVMAPGIKPDKYEILTVNPPQYIYGNMWTYNDGGWALSDLSYLAMLKTDKKSKVDTLRQPKIYNPNIPYTFPGDAEPDGIQMRDETDRQNIQDMVIDAMNKDPETILYFMPVSNNLKAVSAQAIVDMGLYLKTRGDQIMGYSWQLKGQIEAADTLEALNEININEGWPE